ncbi:hypothetical protein [Streptomyces decoyicus]|uniref:hypothetical protein n=1 Tax=Streptomyces decoyicus TaxID=249567 RepID=UPI00386D8CEA
MRNVRNKKAIVAGLALLAVGALQTPASATGHSSSRGETITVRGSGTYVSSVTTTRKPHTFKARAHLILRDSGNHYRQELRGWGDTNNGDTDYRTWSIKRHVPNGWRVCAEWWGYGYKHPFKGMPCVIVHK